MPPDVSDMYPCHVAVQWLRSVPVDSHQRWPPDYQACSGWRMTEPPRLNLRLTHHLRSGSMYGNYKTKCSVKYFSLHVQYSLKIKRTEHKVAKGSCYSNPVMLHFSHSNILLHFWGNFRRGKNIFSFHVTFLFWWVSRKKIYIAHRDIYIPRHFILHFLVRQSILINSLEA